MNFVQKKVCSSFLKECFCKFNQRMFRKIEVVKTDIECFRKIVGKSVFDMLEYESGFTDAPCSANADKACVPIDFVFIMSNIINLSRCDFLSIKFYKLLE